MPFPEEIVTFPEMIDITATDGQYVQQYQEARNRGDTAAAAAALVQIPNYQQKLLTSDLINSMADTCVALQNYFLNKYSPGYIVSETQPAVQGIGDFWIEVTG